MFCGARFCALKAQNKLGYINSNELLSIMPESVAMQDELQSYAKGLESSLGVMQAEGEKEVGRLPTKRSDNERTC